jgi:hypothetical protein
MQNKGKDRPDRTVVGIRYSTLRPFKKMSRLWNKPVTEILSNFIDGAPREYWEQFMEAGMVERDLRSQKDEEKLKTYVLGK